MIKYLIILILIKFICADEHCKTFEEKKEEEKACERGRRLSYLNFHLFGDISEKYQICEKDCDVYKQPNTHNACKTGCLEVSSSFGVDTMFEVQLSYPKTFWRNFYSTVFKYTDGTEQTEIVLEFQQDEESKKPNEVVLERGAAVKSAVNHAHNWLTCVESKTGIPRWVLLSLGIFAAFLLFVMAYQHFSGDYDQPAKYSFVEREDILHANLVKAGLKAEMKIPLVTEEQPLMTEADYLDANLRKAGLIA